MNHDWTDETVMQALIMQTLKLMLKEQNTDRVSEEGLIAQVAEVLDGMGK
jgi:hypothetical protein